MRTVLIIAIAAAALGCRSQQERDHEGTNHQEHAHAEGREGSQAAALEEALGGIEEHFERPSDPWSNTHVGTSAAGTYELRWRATTGVIPLNEGFGLEVWVFEPGGSRPLENVRLRVDAAMPGHGHGMNRVPEVTRGEGGRFFVEGMLFHMTGQWALYLDVGRGAVTERAEFEIVLE